MISNGVIIAVIVIALLGFCGLFALSFFKKDETNDKSNNEDYEEYSKKYNTKENE